MRCVICGGVAHPSTGAEYAKDVVACGPCTREFWAWFRQHMGKWKARPGRSDFYAAAARGPTEEERERAMLKRNTRAKRNPTNFPNPTWRRREIMLPEELVPKLFDWHGGQFTAVYALASTGMRNLVSLSMIDAALRELEGVERKARAADRENLSEVIGELQAVRSYWKEHSYEESGAAEEGQEYEMDTADYGLDPEEEAAIDTHTG